MLQASYVGMSVAITWRNLSVTSENQETPRINTKPRFARLLGSEDGVH